MSEQLALQPRNEQTALKPMEMIQKSLDAALASGDNGLQVASLILEQMRNQRDYEDRARFNAALRRIQDKIQPIVKDSFNPSTKSKYASAQAVDNAIEKLLEHEGMSLSFVPRSSEKDNEVCVVGVLSLGAYSQEYPLPMPADGKGAQGGGVMSRTHATGAAITYAKRYIKNMIFNLRFKEQDDDGNGASGESAGMDERRVTEHIEFIKAASSIADLQTLYLSAQKEADAAHDTRATLSFDKAKRESWARLKKEDSK